MLTSYTINNIADIILQTIDNLTTLLVTTLPEFKQWLADLLITRSPLEKF